MKTLKFFAPLPDLILNGEKTTTWRINDDKNFEVGEVISLLHHNKNTIDSIDSETSSVGRIEYQEFAQAKIIEVKMTTFGELDENDYDGHEKFKSEKEMYETYSRYYNLEVKSETEVKIIKFELIK